MQFCPECVIAGHYKLNLPTKDTAQVVVGVKRGNGAVGDVAKNFFGGNVAILPQGIV